MEARKQFTFYESYCRGIEALPDPNDRNAVLWALVRYALYGQPTELSGVQNAVFLVIKPNLDSARKKAGAYKRASEKYAAALKKNQAASPTGSNKRDTEREKEKDGEYEEEKEKDAEGTARPLSRRERMEVFFEQFWELYPVKIGRADARLAFLSLQDDPERVICSLTRWNDSRRWRKDGGEFIPLAVKFLTQRYFDHEPADSVPRGCSGYLGQAELEAIAQMMEQ